MSLENPNFFTQSIGDNKADQTKGLIEKLQENSKNPEVRQIRYEQNKHLVASFEGVDIFDSDDAIPWKSDSVYLISDGTDGLGMIILEEIAKHVTRANVILTGRSTLSKRKREKIGKLERLGIKVTYKKTDIAKRKAVKTLVKEIQNEFGGLDGIIYCAGKI